ISTLRSCAKVLPDCRLTTKTANPSGCCVERTTALSGTTVTGEGRPGELKFKVAIMPGFSRLWGLGMVTSTEQTRLFGSAEGETEVMCPRNSSGREVVKMICGAPNFT